MRRLSVRHNVVRVLLPRGMPHLDPNCMTIGEPRMLGGDKDTEREAKEEANEGVKEQFAETYLEVEN